MAEQSRRFVSPDKPIDKFIEDQKYKNTLSKRVRLICGTADRGTCGTCGTYMFFVIKLKKNKNSNNKNVYEWFSS